MVNKPLKTMGDNFPIQITHKRDNSLDYQCSKRTRGQMQCCCCNICTGTGLAICLLSNTQKQQTKTLSVQGRQQSRHSTHVALCWCVGMGQVWQIKIPMQKYALPWDRCPDLRHTSFIIHWPLNGGKWGCLLISSAPPIWPCSPVGSPTQQRRHKDSIENTAGRGYESVLVECSWKAGNWVPSTAVVLFSFLVHNSFWVMMKVLQPFP